jgi:hypothetical protein
MNQNKSEKDDTKTGYFKNKIATALCNVDIIIEDCHIIISDKNFIRSLYFSELNIQTTDDNWQHSFREDNKCINKKIELTNFCIYLDSGNNLYNEKIEKYFEIKDINNKSYN